MACVCITGTPGTGKSEAAKALSRLLGWKLIGLNGLAEERRLYCGYDKKRRCMVVDTGRLRKEVRAIANKGGNIIIESHYAHDMPCDAVVVLRANPKVLKKRLEKRGWGAKKVEENMEAEIMEVCRLEALKAGKAYAEIDTSGKKPAEVARLIISRLGLKRSTKKALDIQKEIV